MFWDPGRAEALGATSEIHMAASICGRIAVRHWVTGDMT
jgi:hypothetical protein